MNHKLREFGNAALVLIGVCTALRWGASAAFAAGTWFGSQ